MAIDMQAYLPDDILVKVDRAAMSCSLETRAPLLNHKLVEFAWRLPLNTKIQGSSGKVPLKEVLYRHVPKKLVDRPKMGFGVPMGDWLRGDLREWAEDMLAEETLNRQGYFNTGLIQNALKAHMSGEANNQFYLWDILMFQAWLEVQ